MYKKKPTTSVGANLLNRREIKLISSEISFWKTVLKRDRLPYPARQIKGWIKELERELDNHKRTRMKGAFTAR